jgi:hypothetical protein
MKFASNKKALGSGFISGGSSGIGGPLGRISQGMNVRIGAWVAD